MLDQRTILWTNIALLAASILLAGCDTASKLGAGFGNMGDKALETIGFKKPELPVVPEVPESAKPPRKLKLRIAASDALNVDSEGRSLSLVIRIYKLKNTTAFFGAPYDAFGNSAKEKELLGDDLMESREIVIAPGQSKLIDERWAREATFVGLVALFRAPSPQRWRYAFELETFSIDDGVVLGAHKCGLSIASGKPVSTSAAALKLVPIACSD